jgi:AraC family L-rhamnose operon transcriptional activator RhaR
MRHQKMTSTIAQSGQSTTAVGQSSSSRPAQAQLPHYSAEYVGLSDSCPLRIATILQVVTTLHRHNFVELVIVNQGQGVHLTDTGSFTMHAGDVYLIPEGVAHAYRQVNNLILTNLYFLPEQLHLPLAELLTLDIYRQGLHDGHPVLFHLGAPTLVGVMHLLSALSQEMTQAPLGGPIMARALFCQLLVLLARHGVPIAEEMPEVVEVEAVDRLLAFLERHYSEPLTLEGLAAVGGMSVRSLTRKFKGRFGVTPMTYLQQLRIAHAMELLEVGDDSITDIALLVGFNDSNYFTRLYRRLLGNTPTSYRKLRRLGEMTRLAIMP